MFMIFHMFTFCEHTPRQEVVGVWDWGFLSRIVSPDPPNGA